MKNCTVCRFVRIETSAGYDQWAKDKTSWDTVITCRRYPEHYRIAFGCEEGEEGEANATAWAMDQAAKHVCGEFVELFTISDTP